MKEERGHEQEQRRSAGIHRREFFERGRLGNERLEYKHVEQSHAEREDGEIEIITGKQTKRRRGKTFDAENMRGENLPHATILFVG